MRTYKKAYNNVSAAKESGHAAELFLPVLIAFIILGFSSAFLFLPKQTLSENENRELARAPELSFERLVSGELAEDTREYISDHFPLRGLFIDIKARAELALGKGENNGVIYAAGGYMIDTPETDPDIIDANLSYIARLAAAVDIPVLTAVAPRKLDVLDIYMPGLLRGSGGAVFEGFLESAQNNGVLAVDLYTPLFAAANDGEYVYFKTDHHYTTRGAYLCYREVMAAIGETPYELEDFNIETVSEDFYGTTWSASATFGAEADTIELFRFNGDEEYTVTVLDSETNIDGFYDYEYLSKKDKYGMFLSGTNARVTITANSGEKRGRIFIINDSFANAAVPFLARHYDIELCDPRWLRTAPADYINEGGFELVLVLMNLDSISESRLLAVAAVGT